VPAPRFSLITAVYEPPREAFEDTVRSVLDQGFEDWQWVIADDCSPSEWVRPRLAELAAADPRITVVERDTNGGIVAASNDALAGAVGEYVVLLDHDDMLTRNALDVMAREIDHADATGAPVDYLYSDQDLLTADGEAHGEFIKPDWSPERFRHHMYTTHLSVIRRSLAEEVGGFRPGYDGSQDHDLVLRVTERARAVAHVRKVLYHWRQVEGSAAADPHAKPYAWDAGVRAVQDHLDRVGIRGTVSKGRLPGRYRIEREPDLHTPVSIIIPTIGVSGVVWGTRRTMVTETVRSVLEHSEHRNVEFVVVYDTPTPAHVLDELRAIPDARVRLVEFTEPFNFSAKCNVGALHATGEVLIFLNDDMEAYSEGVIEKLIAPLAEPGVGAVGPKLLFENLHVQHAGVVYGSGTVTHSYYRLPHPHANGAHGDLWINREVTALTGACIAVRRETFEDVGGFTEMLPVNYNDVDFCLKIGSRGLRLLWLHEPVLFHFESFSRDSRVHTWEKELMAARWGHYTKVRERFATGMR
jgi:GT2 family glycosyltransferase